MPPRSNRQHWIAFVALLIAGAPACVQNAALRGPMQVRNQHPAQLTVLHMPFSTAEALPEGAWQGGVDAAYSNLFLSGGGNGNFFTMDGEYLRVGSKHRLGLGGGVELFGELALAHTTPGFLDDFVIDFHNAFGFPSQGRDTAPRDRFGITASRQGAPAFAVEQRDVELLDLPVGVMWTALEPDDDLPLAVGLRAAVELPTGNQDRGFGTGAWDASVGAVAEWRGDWFGITGHVQHTFTGTPDPARAAGLEFRDVTTLGAALELPLSDAVTALVATEWETSTLRDLDFQQVEDPQWLIWTGLRARLEEPLFLELALGEDLSPNTSPDFSLWLSMRWIPTF